MEKPPTKRFKTYESIDENNISSASSFLNCIPATAEEGPLDVILSYCDFQTLLKIQYVSQSHKEFAKETIDKVSTNILDSLRTSGPIECEDSNFDSQTYLSTKMRLGWSEKYATRDDLIDEALTYCDPGGEVSLDIDYDENRARLLLERTGWVDVGDFHEEMQEDEWRSLHTMKNHGGVGEVGWNVEIHYKSQIKRLITVKKLVEKILQMEVNREYNYSLKRDVTVFDLSSSPPKIKFLRNAIMCLLYSKAHPQSFEYTHCDYDYRHTDCGGGGHVVFLTFRTLDGQRIELSGTFSRD